MVVFGAGKKASGTFGDVVGQRDLKDGLLAVAADDDLDGLLIRGEKGTAKSTAVRALAELLPDQRAVADCPYHCPPEIPAKQCSDCRDREDLPTETRSPPLVTLPLGATRDRVVGTLSVADALAGEYEFDPGLLARANRGILYVDEVNLLDDHLVDVLLDAAASGYNRVERDGITVSHPAQFTLIGTMNPEEGELRPQLRDRFALQTEVTACEAIEDRVEIIDRALGEGVSERKHDSPDRSPEKRLRSARKRLSEVSLASEFREEIAELCRDAGIDGHRGDIAMARTARVLAALDDRTTVLEPDVERAAAFALPHRMQSTPFGDAQSADDVIDDHFEDEESGEAGDDGESGEERDGNEDAETGESEDSGEGSEGDDSGGDGESHQSDEQGDDSGSEDSSQPEEDSAPEDAERGSETPAGADSSGHGETASSEQGETDPDESGETPTAEADDDTATPLVPGQSPAGVGESDTPEIEAPTVDTDSGRASGRATTTGGSRGPTVRTKRAGDGDDVDVAASVRASARSGGDSVGSRDLRQSVRAGEAETLLVFAVDASASMRPAMRAAKGTVMELLEDAYQSRDEIAVVTFAGEDADVVLPPTDSVSLAARHLKDLPTGDRTPLPAGLAAAADVLTRAGPDAGIAVVVTDGRANAVDGSPVEATRSAAAQLGESADRTLIVEADADERVGMTETIAEATDGTIIPLSALTADRIDGLAARASR
jgi:magnesium chelatase subunit D